MKIGRYKSREYGSVDVDLQDIGVLFDVYGKDYSEIFNLNSEDIESLRKFKVKSGGELIALKSVEKTLAVMTFRNIDKDCKELGDVMKLAPMFSRSDFAKGLSIASTFVSGKGYCIISYFGKYSFPLIMQAGYKVFRTYDKVNYIVLMGCALLLPLDSRYRKLKIDLTKFKIAPLLLFGLALRKTRSRKNFLRVYAMSKKPFKIRNILDFGILYKYIINDNDNGSPIVFYGDCSPDKVPLGYEYSDNSA